ncbi:MAG TPA: DUF6588 family protein [Balneolales bacterium]|nr:DUF6588 family protein [Balneolales bacterium]
MTVSCIVFVPISSYGQISNIGSFIQSGQQDANVLAKSYLDPLGEGFGPTLNAGWINSVSPHKLLGFDISLRIGASVVPSDARTFSATALSLQNLSYQSGPSNSPTISGPKSSGATFDVSQTVNGQKYSMGTFTMPRGTGWHAVPAPMIQAGIGLIKGTSIMFRFLPKTSVHNYGDVQLWGVGIHHSVNQWIPEGKLLPVKISVFAAYTKLQTNSPLTINPVTDANTTDPYSNSNNTWNGQAVNSTTSAFTVNAIVGKSLPFIGFFAGVGYESSTMKVNTPGSYPVTVPDPTVSNPSHKVVDKIDNPISITMNGANSFRGLVGLQFKLAFFHINAEYVIAKYRVLSTGISFSFR